MAARFLKSKKESIGAAPDDMIFTGVQKLEKPRIRAIRYNETNIEELEYDSVDALESSDFNGMLWLNIDGVHDSILMSRLATMYDLENNVVAKVQDTHSRPKLVEMDTALFISVKMMSYKELDKQVHSENLSMIMKDNLLITFQEQVGDVFEPIRDRLRKGRKRIRTHGADYLAYTLIDVVIDHYVHIASLIGEGIEALDDLLVKDPKNSHLDDINSFKGEINYLRKAVKPVRELVINLAKLDSPLIKGKNKSFYKELNDSIELANDSVDSYREMLSDQLNIFHTNVSYRLNDILKFLTIFSVIFIPITFIAGVYGTNFDHIPELHYEYSYFIMWAVIILTVVFMVYYFKRKKWL